jgi:hypothetical protein
LGIEQETGGDLAATSRLAKRLSDDVARSEGFATGREYSHVGMDDEHGHFLASYEAVAPPDGCALRDLKAKA